MHSLPSTTAPTAIFNHNNSLFHSPLTSNALNSGFKYNNKRLNSTITTTTDRSSSSSSPSNSTSSTSLNNIKFLGKEEEEEEKHRVSALSKTEYQEELDALDSRLTSLNQRRGILTGELYTYKGKFKALSRDYGIPFMVYYTVLWAATGIGSYTAIVYGGVDALYYVSYVDSIFGSDMASSIDPSLGNVAVALVFNELIEPIRLPFVVATVPTVVRLTGFGK